MVIVKGKMGSGLESCGENFSRIGGLVLIKQTFSPLLAIRKDLVEAPLVVRVNTFDEAAVAKFATDMEKANNHPWQPFIPLVVDSYGGSVYGVLSMVDIISRTNKPVWTMVEGKAMSAGAVLFAHGERRFISPTAHIMIHEVSSGTIGKVTDIVADVAQTTRLNDRLLQMLSLRMRKNEDFVKDKLHDLGHADWYLDAKEAVSFGLATDIGLPDLRVKVEVDVIVEHPSDIVKNS
jgi:ATP-dependent Clp protease, protease subunit